jgi:DNA polymerase
MKQTEVAILAGIAEGEPVLTDVGPVPIENVTTTMRVWDGVAWVNHDGVVCRGIKDVIAYDGLTATGDHAVFTTQGLMRFEGAAACGAPLVRSGTDPVSPQADDSGLTTMGRWSADTFDILDAGPRHPFTVSGRLVHNCGFGNGD